MCPLFCLVQIRGVHKGTACGEFRNQTNVIFKHFNLNRCKPEPIFSHDIRNQTISIKVIHCSQLRRVKGCYSSREGVNSNAVTISDISVIDRVLFWRCWSVLISPPRQNAKKGLRRYEASPLRSINKCKKIESSVVIAKCQSYFAMETRRDDVKYCWRITSSASNHDTK